MQTRWDCSLCGGSGWLLGPIGSQWAHDAMRCDCAGGPKGLAAAMRSDRNRDYKLADEIERSFMGVTSSEWMLYGFGKKRERDQNKIKPIVKKIVKYEDEDIFF